MAVELGAGLTEVARANVAEFPNAEVVTADVEKWDSPVAGFDLVVCATAFHWLDPDTRLARLARWLRPGDGAQRSSPELLDHLPQLRRA